MYLSIIGTLYSRRYVERGHKKGNVVVSVWHDDTWSGPSDGM
ncbi:hypothetical protein [Methanocella arvoryzae]|nr:hypothetical protein [Methanocella arvoryzae]